MSRGLLVWTIGACALFGQSAPNVRILLPERTRLLQGQLVDIVLEVRNAKAISALQVTAGSADITSKFGTPATSDLDCVAASGLVIRANLQSFDDPGVPVTAEGPGAFLFTGYMDETDIFFKLATALTGDTAEGDKFVDTVLTDTGRYPRTPGK